MWQARAKHLMYTQLEANIRPGVWLLRINRPKELNALNRQVMLEIANTLQELDRNDACRAVVLTGDAKAFAAGADIKEMENATTVELLTIDQFQRWEAIRKFKKPLIAAVSGFCLGGGCELAMTCDMIVASETAQFGQPEINLGIIPGAGGTQRLTRAVGKATAMEVVLTGRFLKAHEALVAGLINRVVPVELYLDEALALAAKAAKMPPVAVRLAKEAVNKAHETFLADGLEFERKNFYMLFATDDQKEGMKAFIEKRKAQWKGK